MNTREVQATRPEGERSMSFSLATALALLGHDCPGGCPPRATEHRAAVWFAHLPATSNQDILTLVEVDFGPVDWTGARTRALLSAINRCVRGDAISVRQRVGLTLPVGSW